MANPSRQDSDMDKSMTVKAGDILPEARQWVAGVLHVNLADDDELTLALHRKAENEREEQRAAARHRLLGVLAKMDSKTRDVPDAEMDQAIDEAMQFVRSSTGE
jgi:alkylation response protein AidB-like acyl-CoA dehydrogenase